MHALSRSACVVQVLGTVLELLLTEHGQLDTAYCCLQPLEQRLQNVLHMLGHHLNHPSNAAITAPLLESAAKIGAPAVRLLRVLCARLFNNDKYLQQRRIARGAYAEVRLAVHAVATQIAQNLRKINGLQGSGKSHSITRRSVLYGHNLTKICKSGNEKTCPMSATLDEAFFSALLCLKR